MCTQLRLFDNAELRYHDANNSSNAQNFPMFSQSRRRQTLTYTLRVKHFAKTHIRKARVKRNFTQCLSTQSKLFILSGINPNILKTFKDNVNSCIPYKVWGPYLQINGTEINELETNQNLWKIANYLLKSNSIVTLNNIFITKWLKKFFWII
jgi:hypothetical protein